MKFNELRQPYLEEFEGGGGDTAEQTESTTEIITEPAPQAIKVKYNHEEIELPYEEAVTHIQKGMNYEKAVERAKQESRDAFVAEQYAGQLWKGKPITTESELKQALREQKSEEEIRQKYSHLDDDILDELVESKRFREEYEQSRKESERERQQREQTEKLTQEQQKDQTEFLRMFKEENGRVWSEEDKLPDEVINYLKQGKTLSEAYTRHLKDTYKQKINANETNQKNAESSTGSVTGNYIKDTTLTPEMIESMSPKELAKRWPEVKKVLNMK